MVLFSKETNIVTSHDSTNSIFANLMTRYMHNIKINTWSLFRSFANMLSDLKFWVIWLCLLSSWDWTRWDCILCQVLHCTGVFKFCSHLVRLHMHFVLFFLRQGKLHCLKCHLRIVLKCYLEFPNTKREAVMCLMGKNMHGKSASFRHEL